MDKEMTDKEQILFDSVSVGECPIIDRKCREFENCKIRYIIQSLACKTQKFEQREIELLNIEKERNELVDKVIMWMQKCEELKEKYKWYDHYKDSALLNKKLCDKASDERARYRKALEEIERLANENNELLQGYHHEWANNKLILEIISKAKGEGK